MTLLADQRQGAVPALLSQRHHGAGARFSRADDDDFSQVHFALRDAQEEASGFDLYRIGRQIDADRRALRGAGSEIEAAVVFGALDDRAHHETVREMEK